jgi:outer membrane protein assembly factor BamB
MNKADQLRRQRIVGWIGAMPLAAVLITLALGRLAVAESWSHWRGPSGNGAADATAQPPTEFSGSKNVAWKVELPGRGSGSPVVWKDRVFAVSATPASDGTPRKLAFKTFCFARSDGKPLWEATAVEAIPHEGTHATNGFSSASPCSDGKHVYSHFGSRGLYCYTLDGQLVWKRDDFGPMRTRNGFGEGSSPTLAGQLILVPWDHEGPSFLYALDKRTGKTAWKVPRDEPTCWATPLVVAVGDKRQVVMNGQNYARAYDLETGAELWRCNGQTERPAASAVADGGLIFVASGFRGSFLGAFRPDGRGDIRGSANVVWTLDRDTPDVASPLLSQGRLYFYKGKSGLLTCVDAKTGKIHYQAERIPGVSSTYASPVAAGGHVYLTDRNGTITVIKDSPTLQVVATNSVGEPIDATPAPDGPDLFLRTERSLICVRH